ncbi:MAG: hypothetical protein Q4G02_03645 [bacterium]|nr:hypothetical protein [bacterium]
MKKFILPLTLIVLFALGVAVAVNIYRAPKETNISAPQPEAQIEDSNLLTDAEAKELMTQKIAEGMETAIFFAGGFTTDPKQTLATDPRYQLVMHSQISSIQALYDYAYNIYPPDLADEEFYLTDSTTGEEPRFKEANGFLYADQDIGGKGVSADWHTETMEIISQTPDKIVAAIDLYRFDQFESREEVTLIKNTNGNWVFTEKIDR